MSASPNWSELVARSADPQRASAHLRLIRDAVDAAKLDRIEEASAQAFIALLAGSRWLSLLLCQHPEWIELFHDPDTLRHSRRREGILRESRALTNAALEKGEFATALHQLHEVRLHELLRIAVRDLAGLGLLPDILLELSNATDAYLEGILRVVWQQLTARFGEPWHQDVDEKWHRTAFCVLGLGKLGGFELNYSSDVDLLFVYSEEGSTFRTPPKTKRPEASQGLANYQFFKRLCEAFIKEATARGVEGGGVRIDMRLRPEGDSGPLARSLDSYENFYAAAGQTWERMMLLKARGVAGSSALAGEFLEVVQPFRYPRSVGEGLLREMAEMKARIEREIVRVGEIDRNIKLGRGGIREIEFVAQVLQVLHGGRNPFLQTHQTLPALEKLTGYGLLPKADTEALTAAYRFLRNVEHRLQMDEHRQTHTLPEAPEALERIARLMNFPDRAAFDIELRRHTRRVRTVYDQVLGGDAAEPEPTPLPPGFEPAHEPAWRELLARHGFRDTQKGMRLFRILLEGGGVGHMSRRTRELAQQLICAFLDLCPNLAPDAGGSECAQSGEAAQSAEAASGPSSSSDAPPPPEGNGFVLSDPDRVLARLDSYIETYGARSPLYELWTARPMVFAHIIKLFDRSEFLAELAIREPDLVEQLEAGAHLTRQKDAARTLADLRHGLRDEDQHLWLRRYFQTEFARLGLRDILEQVDFEEANAELSALAEACVQYAVEVVTRRARLRKPPFTVIALGKFGGRELVYGSDLDVIFVAPDDTKDLPALQKMAGEVLDLLTARTAQGTVFALDARLRPDGEKGLLVNSLRAHEEYYRHRAMLWEIQALTRARPVAGHVATGESFQHLAETLSNLRKPSQPLAAFRPDWKAEIRAMRLRIERERTPAGKEALAFKTGAGGLIDAEFLAQTLAMEHGWFEPNTLHSLERAKAAGAFEPGDADILITNFRHLRRMESILRRWSFEGETVLPEDPGALYRVAVRCGYRHPDPFMADVARWRAEIRLIYDSAMSGSPA